MHTHKNRSIKLTDREWSVVQLLAQGTVPGRIAEELNITDKTVSQYINTVQLKLRLENRLVLQNYLIALKKESSQIQHSMDAMMYSRVSPHGD